MQKENLSFEDLRLLQPYRPRIKSAGMSCCVNGQVIANISDDPTVSIFQVKQSKHNKDSFWTAWPWRWRQQAPCKGWELLPQQHSTTSQKNWTFRICVYLFTDNVTLPWRSHLPLYATMFHILLFKSHHFFFTSSIQKFCIYSSLLVFKRSASFTNKRLCKQA